MNQNPERIQELMDRYEKLIEEVKDQTTRFLDADSHFKSWSGPTREALQNNFKEATPAFDRMIETVTSYKTTASASASRTMDLERNLTNKLAA